MEGLYIVGAFLLFCLIAWIVEEVGKFLETRRYKKKLKRLRPVLDAIDTAELCLRLSEIRQAYSSITQLLQQKYEFSKESENVKTIDQYVQEETNYRRSKRKATKRTYRRKRVGYRRYY